MVNVPSKSIRHSPVSMGLCHSHSSKGQQQQRDKSEAHSLPVLATHPLGILDMGCSSEPTPSESDLKEPRLPTDLEREIFEIAALHDRSSINRLMLVAKRVKAWIEPILYTVILQTKWDYPLPNYPPLYENYARDTKDPRFKEMTAWGKHVGLQNMKVSQAMEILESCINVQDLALWIIIGSHKPLRQIIPTLPVRRLHVDIERFFSEDPSVGPRRDLFTFDHIPLMNLTHLHILLFPTVPWAQWKSIALLPSLSHLAIDGWDVEFTKEALEKCKSLELFVVINVLRTHFQELQDTDSRLVTLAESQWIQSWETGALTGNDIWTRAELARKQRHNTGTSWFGAY
ncbi:hypothetical protein M413DRAFT_24797 [Hebeloma cylindrosporum]|uniref:Uncharacterized protein n=1 Tax=Hebeloma cylindrosporum TaxID=76867 RepID=A0A0C2YXH2_HEBCY|nr:hypothetical protein M413DRAFT_24797 [Hebeloma cylindrosporum h7]